MNAIAINLMCRLLVCKGLCCVMVIQGIMNYSLIYLHFKHIIALPMSMRSAYKLKKKGSNES